MSNTTIELTQMAKLKQLKKILSQYKLKKDLYRVMIGE